MYKSLLLCMVATLCCACLNAQTSSGDASSSGSSQPQHVRVSWGVEAGNVIHEAQPQYPDVARQNHIFGEVLLALHIDKEGTVTEVKPLTGNPIFTHAAKEVLVEWKFRPYRLNGSPVDVDTQIACYFGEKGSTVSDPCHAEN